MRYYKFTNNGYIVLVGIGNGGTEITEEEYNAIQNAIASKPTPTETTDYMLTENLEWVAFAVEPVDPDIDEAEAFNIIFGGAE